MNKFSKFLKENKKTILVAGTFIVGGAVVALMAKGFDNRHLIDITGKAAITWDPLSGSNVNLERVKEFLETNANTTDMFAIFREGVNADEYSIILLNK